MKSLLSFFFIITCIPSVHSDEYQKGYASSSRCTKTQYREQYFPGTANEPGYVKSWNEVLEIPCDSQAGTKNKSNNIDDFDNNDCKEGSVIGGLLGAGLSLSGTRGKDRWWAVPAGGAAGAMIGCQIDGG